MGSHATAPAAAASPAKNAAVATAGPSTSAEDKEKAVNTKVLFVCREVYETEAAYVKDLQTIIHIFMHPVSSRGRTRAGIPATAPTLSGASHAALGAWPDATP